MYTIRLFRILMIVTFVFVTACTAPVVATPKAPSAPVVTSTQDQPITLRLAVADEQGRPSDPYVHEFIDQVKTLSDGNITIEPTWDAGSATDAGFETGVIQLVKKGDYDLGLAASRAFDNENITSFQALQAPFLIDNDALAQAVAMSDTATRMLENLSSASLVGLTMWPEDLRHPFSLVPGKPILMPEDLAGRSVRATPSQATYKLIESLGGTPMMGDEYQAAESGLRQGASLTGTPTATGNIVFFAKFQVLLANGSVFEKLSDRQRATLHQAAVATEKKAIAEHPSDVDAGDAWCADGGTIVLASNEQVAAFQKAAQPVLDELSKDSFNAESVPAIRELKAKTQPSQGAQACAPTAAVSTQTSPEKQTWSQGLPPNGVWQVELSVDDFVRMGVSRSKAEKEWAGTYTLTFQDGKYKFDYQGPSGLAFDCEADLVLRNDVVNAIYTSGENCQNGLDVLQWRLDADGLHLHLVSIRNAPYLENKAFYEAKPWQKIAD